MCTILSWPVQVDHQSGVLFEANPLLSLAVLARRRKVATYLLAVVGASPNGVADRGGFTPLMDAAWSGDLALVRLLLVFGADPAATGHSHFSGGIKSSGPWHDAAGWAAHRGHAEVVRHLREWAAADPAALKGIMARGRAAARAALAGTAALSP